MKIRSLEFISKLLFLFKNIVGKKLLPDKYISANGGYIDDPSERYTDDGPLPETPFESLSDDREHPICEVLRAMFNLF